MAASFHNFIMLVTPWVHAIGVAATSWLAWRIYALFGGVLILVGSFWAASSQRNMILELRPHRGPKPKVRRTINKRLRELDEFEKGKFAEAVRRVGLLFVFGFVVPSLILAAAIYCYPWFMPGHEALSVARCPEPSALKPTFLSTALFIVSQLAMGIFNNTADLLSGSLGAYIPNYAPTNTLVAAALVGYRYFIALFVGIFIHLVGMARSVSDLQVLRERRAELEKALAEATH